MPAPARSSPPTALTSFPLPSPTPHRVAYAISFFLLGLLNNVLYVVILSAALDLVGRGVPKGVILFVNIAPALLVKICWPYFVRGRVRYGRRVASCSAISFLGILIVALSPTLFPRLSGIALASFSSGLGEMTYLQLSTVYGLLPSSSSSAPSESGFSGLSAAGAGGAGRDLGGIAVGWFASGTGAAGLVGAGLWWVLRGLGVRRGLMICSVLPLCMSATFFLLLPSFEAMSSSSSSGVAPGSFAQYAQLDVDDDVELSASEESEGEEDDDDDDQTAGRSRGSRGVRSGLLGGGGKGAGMSAASEKGAGSLSTKEKVRLARPLVVRYMLPLFFVYLAEYTINSGVAPTLIYELPSSADSPVLGSVIKSLRDYYPLYSLIYQTGVFISRSSLSILHLPPLPIRLLPLPTLFQLALLALTSLQSLFAYLQSSLGSENAAIWATLGMVALEGLAGGAAYVNCFFWLGVEEGEREDDEDFVGTGNAEEERRKLGMEREFRIASVGFADTLGILVASLVASALEPALCNAQVARGRTLCKEL